MTARVEFPLTDRVAFKPDDAVAKVRARLTALGCADELAHLERLGPYELDVLVRLERGWGSTGPWTTPPPADAGRLSTVLSPGSVSQSTEITTGCTPGTPQADRGTMAA